MNLVDKYPKQRYNSIRKIYLKKYKLNVHRRTINNYLLRKDYREFLKLKDQFHLFNYNTLLIGVRKVVKRPSLTPRHIKQRVILANKYKNNLSKVDRMIFSDEKKFLANSNAKTELVTRKIGSNPYEHQFIQFSQLENNKADINIWSYIGPFGKGNHNIFNALNKHFYLNICGRAFSCRKHSMLLFRWFKKTGSYSK